MGEQNPHACCGHQRLVEIRLLVNDCLRRGSTRMITFLACHAAVSLHALHELCNSRRMPAGQTDT